MDKPRIFIRKEIKKEIDPLVHLYFLNAHPDSQFPYAVSDIKEGTLCQDPDQREPLVKQTMDDGFLEIRISGKKIYCSSHKEGEVTCKTIRSKSTGKEKPAFTAKGSRQN